jgi:hypothetical protein
MKKKNKKPTQKKVLQRLNKIWDKRLAEIGFSDIEDRRTGLLKNWSGTISHDGGLPNPEQPNSRGLISLDLLVQQTELDRVSGSANYSSLVWKESQAEYYRLASQYLHEKEFKTIRARIIWQLHSEGLSQYKIAKELKTTRREIRYAIEEMEKEFGLKLA